MQQVVEEQEVDGGVEGSVDTSPQPRRRTKWLRTLASRLAWSVATLLLATFAVFTMLELAPGDAASRVAGPDATPEVIEQVRAELRLDDPLMTRYWEWLGGVAQGDLGNSLVTGEPVTEMAFRTLPRTLSLLLVASVISVVVALGAALAVAMRPGGFLDRFVVGGTTLGIAIPSFWLGLILIDVFALRAGWFPPGGYQAPQDGAWTWLQHLILPAIALSGVFAAELTRQLRASLQDSLKRDYIVAARMKGIGVPRLLGKHALKNAAAPVVTVFGVRLAQLLGGTVVVERVFAVNGIGALLIDAVLARDIPVVLGIVVVFAIIIIIMNVIVDAAYPYFDPRLR